MDTDDDATQRKVNFEPVDSIPAELSLRSSNNNVTKSSDVQQIKVGFTPEPSVPSRPLGFLLVPSSVLEHITLEKLRELIHEEYADDPLLDQHPWLASDSFSYLYEGCTVSQRQERSLTAAQMGAIVTLCPRPSGAAARAAAGIASVHFSRHPYSSHASSPDAFSLSHTDARSRWPAASSIVSASIHRPHPHKHASATKHHHTSAHPSFRFLDHHPDSPVLVRPTATGTDTFPSGATPSVSRAVSVARDTASYALPQLLPAISLPAQRPVAPAHLRTASTDIFTPMAPPAGVTTAAAAVTPAPAPLTTVPASTSPILSATALPGSPAASALLPARDTTSSFSLFPGTLGLRGSDLPSWPSNMLPPTPAHMQLPGIPGSLVDSSAATQSAVTSPLPTATATATTTAPIAATAVDTAPAAPAPSATAPPAAIDPSHAHAASSAAPAASTLEPPPPQLHLSTNIASPSVVSPPPPSATFSGPAVPALPLTQWHRAQPCPGNAVIRVYGLREEVLVLQGVEQLFDLYLNHQPHGASDKLVWVDVEMGPGVRSAHYAADSGHGPTCGTGKSGKSGRPRGASGWGCACAAECECCNKVEASHAQASVCPSESGLCCAHDVFGMVCAMYNVHPVTVEDLLTHDDREKLEVFPDYLFLVLNALGGSHSGLTTSADDDSDDSSDESSVVEVPNGKFRSTFPSGHKRAPPALHVRRGRAGLEYRIGDGDVWPVGTTNAKTSATAAAVEVEAAGAAGTTVPAAGGAVTAVGRSPVGGSGRAPSRSRDRAQSESTLGRDRASAGAGARSVAMEMVSLSSRMDTCADSVDGTASTGAVADTPAGVGASTGANTDISTGVDVGFSGRRLSASHARERVHSDSSVVERLARAHNDRDRASSASDGSASAEPSRQAPVDPTTVVLEVVDAETPVPAVTSGTLRTRQDVSEGEDVVAVYRSRTRDSSAAGHRRGRFDRSSSRLAHRRYDSTVHTDAAVDTVGEPGTRPSTRSPRRMTPASRVYTRTGVPRSQVSLTGDEIVTLTPAQLRKRLREARAGLLDEEEEEEVDDGMGVWVGDDRPQDEREEDVYPRQRSHNGLVRVPSYLSTRTPSDVEPPSLVQPMSAADSIGAQARAHLHESPLKLLIYSNLVLSFHSSSLNTLVETLFDRLHVAVGAQLLQESAAARGPQWHVLAQQLGFRVDPHEHTRTPHSPMDSTDDWWGRAAHASRLSLRTPMAEPPLLSERVRRVITSARALHCTLDLVVDTFQPVVSELCAQVEVLEDLAFALSIFEHRDLLKRIAIVRKRLAWCLQNLSSKDCVLAAMLGAEWRERLSTLDVPYLRDVSDHNTRMMQKLTQASDMLQRLQDTYLATVNNEVALASERMNVTMGKLTSVSMIFMPLSLIPGLMGMNCFVPFQAGEPLEGGVDYLVDTLPFIGIVAFMALLGMGFMHYLQAKDLL